MALQHDYTAAAWSIMEWMGAINVVKELNGNGDHCLENVITLDVGIHMLFDGQNLWFEAMVNYHFIALVSVYLI